MGLFCLGFALGPKGKPKILGVDYVCRLFAKTRQLNEVASTRRCCQEGVSLIDRNNIASGPHFLLNARGHYLALMFFST